MKRVTGIGGIFFKAKDPAALQAWYAKHLGIAVETWGGAILRNQDDPGGTTIWSPMAHDTEYFNPSAAPFMINYRVENLAALLEALRAEGCTVDEKTQDAEYGKFGWVMDPEGNRIELWEPPSAS